MANKVQLLRFKHFTQSNYPQLHAKIIEKVGDSDDAVEDYRKAWVDCATEYDDLHPGFLAGVAEYAQRILDEFHLSNINDATEKMALDDNH